MRWFFARRRNNRTHRPAAGRAASPRRARKLRFEGLETRHMLAGDVTAAVDGDGNLVVSGDADNNDVFIGLENGDLIVQGINGTTVNGSNNAFVAFTGPGAEIIGDLTVRMGDGNDSVLVGVDVVVNGDAKLTGQAGRDFIALDNAEVSGNLQFIGQQGVDQFVLRNTDVGGNVRMGLGSNNDVVSVDEGTFSSDLAIRAVSGSDAVVLNDLTLLGNALLRGAKGNDAFLLTDVAFAGDIDVFLGGDDDFYFIDPSTVGGNTNIFGRNGNDTAVAQGANVFTGELFFDGGLGVDAGETDPDGTYTGGVSDTNVEKGHVSNEEIAAGTDPAEQKAADAQAKIPDLVPLTLDLDDPTIANPDVEESNDTLLTDEATYTVEGTTAPNATVSIDADNDGQFDDGSDTADGAGLFSIDVTLAAGANTLEVRAESSGQNRIVDVAVYFAEGTVVRFDTTLGTFDVELLDADAPNTVAGFLSDLTRYVDSIFHRATEGSFSQGGSFIYDDGTNDIDDVTPFGPVNNEFDADNSNVRGTLSAALLPGDEDSFDGGWFFNVADNSAALDADLHTVFGRIIGGGLSVIDAINALDTFDINADFTETALSTTPLRNFTDGGPAPDETNFIFVNSIAEVTL